MGSDELQLKSVNQASQYPPLYLHLEGEHRLPRILGTGRSAVVFLASTTDNLDSPANAYRAVKFLRDDVDKQYAQAAAERFFQEAGQAQRFDMQQGAFVRFYGWGAIDAADSGKPWWKLQYAKHIQQITNDDSEFARLMKHFDLQGPFYVLDLCQGTLHDLLDKSVQWIDLPPYAVPIYRNAIVGESSRIAKDIREVRHFFRRNIYGLSGYDIMNSFKSDGTTAEGNTANRIRNFAILEMFSEIADTVAKLHTKKSEIEPLAHRDLKPGNIFFEHTASEKGLDQIKIKLSDLGYVVASYEISRGEMTLIAGKKGADYLAPGSQFFRAPEQAELPIEVRVDVDADDPKIVRIKGSKLGDIQPHDWLTLSDLFNDQTREPNVDPNVFKILKVDPDWENNIYRLELNRPVTTSKSGDLQGQITYATGFHTDGFSLGAILYDLISGGRNPELFYTYCLASYTKQFAQDAQYSIDDIVEILSPKPSSNAAEKYESDKLTLSEKSKALQQVWSAHGLDDLLGAIQDAILLQRNQGVTTGAERLQEKLKHFRFRNFQLVRELLTDRRGVPIPRDILEVIVRCMVRDVEGAYYRRDPINAFQTDESYEAASHIHQRIQELLAKEEYQLPRDGFPRSLQANLLFKLRSLAPEDV